MKSQLLKSNHLFTRLFSLLMILGLLFVLPMCTDNKAADKTTKEDTEANTEEEVTMTPIEEGKAFFISYCYMCHGEDGKGGGTLAENLKNPPADLTTITLRHGEFSKEMIHTIIAGVEDVPGHSKGDMPAWFETFKESEGITDEKVINQKIDNIVAYLETIQQSESTEE